MTPPTGRTEPSAIILAAGYSRRMGRFKPLMELGGQRVIDRVVSLYRHAGIADIRVVTGHRAQTVAEALAGQTVTLILNPHYDTGMFGSIKAGIRSLQADCQAFFVHPVDIPLVRPHTLTMLVEAAKAKPSPVAYPTFDGRRGHPPLISGDMRKTILADDDDGGLRAILDRYQGTALNVPVADAGVLSDLDTPEDFERLSVRAAASTILSDDECRSLMETVRRLPATIVAHCRKVADVAEALGEAVNAAGGTIHLHRLRSAALVHDVARLENDHAGEGARILEMMGYPDLAAIVASHMEIVVDTRSPLDEAQLLYLADKLVRGNAVVGIRRRFDASLEAHGQDSATRESITRRRCSALMVQAKVERLTGTTIDRLLQEANER